MAAYAEAKDLIDIGAYKSGANAITDHAIALHHPIIVLQQRVDERNSFEETQAALAALFNEDAALERQRNALQ